MDIPNKERLVIIGANDFQKQLIIRANDLGYETHVFAWEDGATGKDSAYKFYPISIVEMDIILKKCKEINPMGICSVGSDLAIKTVDYIADKLGLIGNSLSSSESATNKYLTRQKLSLNGIPTPKFQLFTGNSPLDSLKSFNYPLIVKPTDRSGSRGITKIQSISHLSDAIKYSLESSFSKEVIVEEYITGSEYSCETISHNGEHRLLAITKKYTTGSPNFIEIGHTQPDDLDYEIREKISKILFKSFDTLGLKNGAFHPEIIITTESNIYIIEIGPRMGGDCIGSDLVEISTGYDYLKMVIDVACNKQVEFKQAEQNHALIRFILNENDYKNMLYIEKTHPDWIYRISDITMSDKTISSSEDRYGYYILKISDKSNFEILKEALFA